MKKHTCRTSHGTISVIDTQGTGMPVLLIHGNSLGSESYEPQLSSELGRRWRLIAVDLPGHGESPPAADPDGTYCLSGYATIVTEVASALGAHKPVLVGHSLGGNIAMNAVAQGLAVSGLFIFGTPPLHSPADIARAFCPAGLGELFFNPSPSDAQIALAAELCMPEGVRPPAYYERSLRHTDPPARDRIGKDMVRGGHPDEPAVVTSLGGKAAVAVGAKDRIVSLSYVQGLGLKTCWRKQVQVIPDAGHCPQYDTPEAFNRLLAEYLNELGR